MSLGSKLIILVIVGMMIFTCTLTDDGPSSSITAVNKTNESIPGKGLDCSRFLSQVVKFDIRHLELEKIYNVKKADCLDINAKAAKYSTKHCKMNVGQRVSLIYFTYICVGLPTDNMKNVLANGVYNYPDHEYNHFFPFAQEYLKKNSVLNRPPRSSGGKMNLLNLVFILSVAIIFLLL